MLITNLVISNITNRVNHCIIKATFSNISEPEDCRDFNITIKNEPSSNHCLQFCVFNKRSNRLEDVQSMFSDELINYIMKQILLLSTKQINLLDHEVEAI